MATETEHQTLEVTRLLVEQVLGKGDMPRPNRI